MNNATCPECYGTELFAAETLSGGLHGPMLLPHLSTGFLKTNFPPFNVVVCTDCGLIRFYAEADARQRLRANPKWKRIGQEQQPAA